jgi:hypothetical protein
MNIPSQIKIGGVLYSIVIESRSMDHGIHDAGACYPANAKIWLESSLDKQVAEQTLVHEILEAIDSHNDLGLSHQTISTIADNLYQILKNNNFLQ